MFRTLTAAALSLILAACGGGGGDDTSEAPAAVTVPADAVRVYLFVGQSNMAGADAVIDPGTGTRDLVDMGQQTDADRSTLFTYASKSVFYPWGDVRGHNGSHLGETMLGGKPVKQHGPEVGFGRAMGGNVAVIKYSDNFTATENGRSPWVKPGSRWAAWQAHVDASLQSLGRPYVIAGFVYFQGIDDGLLHRGGDRYQDDVEHVAADLRAKFGKAPFVIVRSIDSQIAGSSYMAPIRAAQVTIGQQAGNRWVDVDGLPLAAIHHMTAEGQLEVGRRIAEQFAK